MNLDLAQKLRFSPALEKGTLCNNFARVHSLALFRSHRVAPREAAFSQVFALDVSPTDQLARALAHTSFFDNVRNDRHVLA